MYADGIPVDPRPKREVKPMFDEAQEEQKLTNQLLDGGQSIEQATKNARALVRGSQARLAYAEDNGEAVWTGLNGLTARGDHGLFQLAQQILERDRIASFGPAPLVAVRERLRARGYTDSEIDRVARNRLHRQADGTVNFDGRLSGEGNWTPENLASLAEHQFVQELGRRRALEPDPVQDAAMRQRRRDYSV